MHLFQMSTGVKIQSSLLECWKIGMAEYSPFVPLEIYFTSNTQGLKYDGFGNNEAE